MLPRATQLFAFSLSPTQECFTHSLRVSTVASMQLKASHTSQHNSMSCRLLQINAIHTAQRNSMHIAQPNAT